MTTKDIKKFLKTRYGLKSVRVRQCGSGKHFLEAWIPCNPTSDHRTPISWPELFPLDLRVEALRLIYGDKEWVTKGDAGNVRPHMIALRPIEWDQLTVKFSNQ